MAAVPLINTRVPPLSIACLAAFMKAEGHYVKSFDFNIETYTNVTPDLKEYWTFYKGFHWTDNSYFESYIYPNIIGKNIDSWVSRIMSEDPDIVGISVTNSPSAKILAQRIRKDYPHVKIIIGGPKCSKTYDHPDYRPCEFYDVVVHNEGELTLAEVVRNYQREGKFVATLGASCLGDNGEIIFPGLREVQMEVDHFPTPDFDDFDFSRYVDADNPTSTFREIPYWSSRGCPARCNFCMDYKMWDLRFRQKSPQRIVEEMEYLSSRYGIYQFMLIELIFNGHIPKMRELTQELVRRKHKFKMWGHGRVDPRMDLETMNTLREAGFEWFIFGLETASDKVLKIMRKGYNKETADRVLNNLRLSGINCSVNVICGFPGEDWRDYRETIEFIYHHRKAIFHMPGLADCAVMPGSDLFLTPKKFAIKTEGNVPPPPLDWETEDGTNTLKVRLFRKEFMLKVFKQVCFKGKDGIEEDRPLEEIMPVDPEVEFRKLYPDHP